MFMFVLLAAFSPWVPEATAIPKTIEMENDTETTTTTKNDELNIQDKGMREEGRNNEGDLKEKVRRGDMGERKRKDSGLRRRRGGGSLAFMPLFADSAATLTAAELEDSENTGEGLLGKNLELKNNFAEAVRAQWAAFSLRKVLMVLVHNWRTIAFMISLMVMAWINVLGNFLFMFLRQDLNAPGLVLALAMGITVLMELPFFFYSKNMLHLIGIAGCTIVGHLALITRSLSNPWWVLPIEITHGIAFSCIWTAGVTYFGQIAPKGREATFQGIFAGIWNIGGGMWSLVGGEIYDKHGPKNVFRTCAAAIGLSLILYIISIIGHVPKLNVEVTEIKTTELEEIALEEEEEREKEEKEREEKEKEEKDNN